MRHIPNFITSLNLTSGFAALIFAASGDTLTAAWLILAAMIFDFADGLSARLLKAYSAIGKELDSLADVVSFGVAPGYLIYTLLKASFLPAAAGAALPAGPITVLTIGVSALMPVCAALRLAIFNIDETQATTFRGMPTPANALAVISLIIAAHYAPTAAVTKFTSSPLMLVLFTLALSLLMVSRIPLLSLKTKHLKLKGNEGRYLMAGLVIISLALAGLSAAPLIIPIYLAASLAALLFHSA